MGHRFTEIRTAKANWEVIYHVVASSGNSHNPRSFAIDILRNMGKLIAYDAGLAFFLDQNGNVVGTERTKVKDSWRENYEAFFSYIEDKPYKYLADVREDPRVPTINVHDWNNEVESPAMEFMRPTADLKHSCDFALFDLNGNYKTIFSLDRHYNTAFSNQELYNLQLALIQLNQMHKNFYYRQSYLDVMKQDFWTQANLTAREIEVVDLLSQGVTPNTIGDILCISMSTTYKHIAHIYEKLHVSSRQELMCLLLARGE